MIVGILLKNYKIYNGIRYIPVTTNHNFIAYIGDNGVGKSSILEALDTYFNGREWNYHKGVSLSGPGRPYIVILNLLEKNKVRLLTKGDDETLQNIEKISEYFYNIDDSKLPKGIHEDVIDFIKNDLKIIANKYKDTHFFVVSGIGYDKGDKSYFGSFDGLIANAFNLDYSSQENDNEEDSEDNKNGELRKKFEKLNSIVKSYYSYIYVPVEINIENFTKIETQNMQKLMGKNISYAIKNIITQKRLDDINLQLNNFIKKLEESLNNKYLYKNDYRSNISMLQMIQKVTELFFSIRTLHKGKIKAENLSSGEKRQALIDIATALIKNQEIEGKEVVLAIDEPESSLNVSKIFTQFEKLSDLKKEYTQIIITTHWYGFLPIVSNGSANFLYKDNNRVKISTFDLFNYRELIRQTIKNKYSEMPYDIQLKSLHDLVQSIVSSVRLDEPYNWLICEGSSDKIYFDFYFEDLVKNNNLKILPVGGASEVIKIYNYLRLPTSEKDNIKGKICCLIDSDGKSEQFTCDNSIKSMVAKRILNKNNDQKTSLIDVSSNDYEMKTEIEDCLDGAIFIETLKTYTEDQNIVAILENKKTFKDKSLNSYFCFDLKPSEQKVLKNFFDQDSGYRKIEFAKKYVKIARSNSVKNLDWINEIRQWLKEKNIK
jgi:hypothetical protein